MFGARLAGAAPAQSGNECVASEVMVVMAAELGPRASHGLRTRRRRALASARGVGEGRACD